MFYFLVNSWGWGLGIGDWAQSPIPNNFTKSMIDFKKCKT